MAEIGLRLFLERKKELKHYYDQTLRLVNELYRNYSEKFRVFVVINALFNFAEHFNNNHDRCNQFIWYSRCGYGVGCPEGSNCPRKSKFMYEPEKTYVNQMKHKKNALLDELVPLFFKLNLCAFVLSPYNESMIYKIIDNTRTSINESFNHHDRIMMSKGLFYDPFEAEYKGLMSFIAFDLNQKQKNKNPFSAPKLVANKYADT